MGPIGWWSLATGAVLALLALAGWGYAHSGYYVAHVRGIAEIRRRLEGPGGRNERLVTELPEWTDYVLAPVVVIAVVWVGSLIVSR